MAVGAGHTELLTLESPTILRKFRPDEPHGNWREVSGSGKRGRSRGSGGARPLANGPSSRLDSWKAIADYLGRDVRTAIRWEKERGLPVHRLPGGKRGGVYALGGEIDAWLRQDGVPGGEATVESQPGPTPPAPVGHPEATPRVRSHRRLSGLIGALCLTAIAGGLTLLGSHPGRTTAVAFEGNSVVGRDEKGAVVWRYAFQRPLVGAGREEASRPNLVRIRVEDLHGDGHQQTLAVASFSGDSSAAAEGLFCLSEAGRPLWVYEPDLELSFGGRRFGPPWQFQDLVVSKGPGHSKTLWAVLARSPWWPAILVRIDPLGHARLEFVNSGALYFLRVVNRPDGVHILAGGVNNEYGAAALVALREGDPPSASPQTAGLPFHCDDCPEGRPSNYYLLPTSELTRLAGKPYDRAMALRPFGDLLELNVWESEPLAQVQAETIYYLSADFAPERVVQSDGHWVLHRQLEAAGKILHPEAQCPERTGRAIRAWDPKRGWIDEWARAYAGSVGRPAATKARPGLRTDRAAS